MNNKRLVNPIDYRMMHEPAATCEVEGISIRYWDVHDDTLEHHLQFVKGDKSFMYILGEGFLSYNAADEYGFAQQSVSLTGALTKVWSYLLDKELTSTTKLDIGEVTLSGFDAGTTIVKRADNISLVGKKEDIYITIGDKDGQNIYGYHSAFSDKVHNEDVSLKEIIIHVLNNLGNL